MAAEFGVRVVQDVHGLQGPRDLAERHPGHGRRPDLLGLPAGARQIPGGVAIVHCENMELIELHQKPFMAAGRQDTAAWSDARPEFGELEAIRRMVPVRGGRRRPAPHPPHGRGPRLRVPAPEGVGRAAAWPPRRCPHYLRLRQGHRPRRAGQGEPAAARARTHIEALWQRLTDGTVDVMGSDHCPYTKAVKGAELWAARAGITARQRDDPARAARRRACDRGRLTLQDVVRLTSYQRRAALRALSAQGRARGRLRRRSGHRRPRSPGEGRSRRAATRWSTSARTRATWRAAGRPRPSPAARSSTTRATSSPERPRGRYLPRTA